MRLDCIQCACWNFPFSCLCVACLLMLNLFPLPYGARLPKLSFFSHWRGMTCQKKYSPFSSACMAHLLKFPTISHPHMAWLPIATLPPSRLYREGCPKLLLFSCLYSFIYFLMSNTLKAEKGRNIRYGPRKVGNNLWKSNRTMKYQCNLRTKMIDAQARWQVGHGSWNSLFFPARAGCVFWNLTPYPAHIEQSS